MNFILICEVGTEWNFRRSYIIQYEVILPVKFGYFSLLKEITDLKFQRIYEDNRSFPNDDDLKFNLKIFNMIVDFI